MLLKPQNQSGVLKNWKTNGALKSPQQDGSFAAGGNPGSLQFTLKSQSSRSPPRRQLSAVHNCLGTDDPCKASSRAEALICHPCVSLYPHMVVPPGVVLTVTKVTDMLGIAIFRGNPYHSGEGGGGC